MIANAVRVSPPTGGERQFLYPWSSVVGRWVLGIKHQAIRMIWGIQSDDS